MIPSKNCVGRYLVRRLVSEILPLPKNLVRPTGHVSYVQYVSGIPSIVHYCEDIPYLQYQVEHFISFYNFIKLTNVLMMKPF